MCCLKNSGRTLFCLCQNKAWQILKEQSMAQAQEALVLLWRQARSAQCLRSSSACAAAEQGGDCTGRQQTRSSWSHRHSLLYSSLLSACPADRLPGSEPLCAGTFSAKFLLNWAMQLCRFCGTSGGKVCSSSTSKMQLLCLCAVLMVECGVSAQLLSSAPHSDSRVCPW